MHKSSTQKLSVPSILLMILMVSSLFSRYSLTIRSYPIRPEHFAIVLIIPLVFLFFFVFEKSVPIYFNNIAMLFFLWIIVNFSASYLKAENPMVSYRYVIRLASLGLVTLLTIYIVSKEKYSERLWFFWLLFGLVVAIYGIFVATFALSANSTLGVQISRDAPMPRPYATLYEANIFGSYVGAIHIMLLSLWIYKRNYPAILNLPNYFLQGTLFITGVALLFSMTRGAWLSVAIMSILGIIGLTWGKGQQLRKVVIAYMLIMLSSLIIVSLLYTPSVLTSRLSGEESSSTVSGRMEEWQLGFEDWQESLLIGHGTGGFEQRNSTESEEFPWLSFLFLRLLVESGIIGFLAFLAFLGSIAYQTFCAIRQLPPDSIRKAMLISTSLGLGVLIIAYQFTDATWLLPFWIFLGLLSGLGYLPATADIPLQKNEQNDSN